jgi:hypothetical protein
MINRKPNRNQQSRGGPENKKPAKKKYPKPVEEIRLVIKLQNMEVSLQTPWLKPLTWTENIYGDWSMESPENRGASN